MKYQVPVPGNFPLQQHCFGPTYSHRSSEVVSLPSATTPLLLPSRFRVYFDGVAPVHLHVGVCGTQRARGAQCSPGTTRRGTCRKGTSLCGSKTRSESKSRVRVEVSRMTSAWDIREVMSGRGSLGPSLEFVCLSSLCPINKSTKSFSLTDRIRCDNRSVRSMNQLHRRHVGSLAATVTSMFFSALLSPPTLSLVRPPARLFPSSSSLVFFCG